MEFETANSSGKYIKLPDNSDFPAFLQEIKERLETRVIGQPRPIKRILRGITAFYAGLNDPRRPLGVFMFAGPSGTGKTYLAEELAKAFLGDSEENEITPLIKIDCGSLSLEHTVASLTGSPPGYVGYKDKVPLEMVGEYDKKKRGLDRVDKKIAELIKKAQDGLAKAGMRERAIKSIIRDLQASLSRVKKEIEEYQGPPRSIVLFDEIEKADMNIQSQLLRILDEGKLDLLNGRRVDFRGSIIILTTNVGTEQILSDYLSAKKIGFPLPDQGKPGADKNLDQAVYKRVLDEIQNMKKKYFKPELLARIGKPGIIVFHVLAYEDYQKILELQLNEFQNSFPSPILISYTPEFKEFLIKEGVSPVFGARALRSVIDKYVRTPISEKILLKEIKIRDIILLDINSAGAEPHTVISIKQRPAKVSLQNFKTREKTLDIAIIENAFDKFFSDFFEEQKRAS